MYPVSFPMFSRFKIEISNEIHLLLDDLVSIVNEDLGSINSNLIDVLIADTTGLGGYVIENNPKFLETKIC